MHTQPCALRTESPAHLLAHRPSIRTFTASHPLTALPSHPSIPGGPTPIQTSGMLLWKLGGVPSRLNSTSFLQPEASCVSSGSCLYRAGQPHLASVAASLGGLNLSHERWVLPWPALHPAAGHAITPGLPWPPSSVTPVEVSWGGQLHTSGTLASTSALNPGHCHNPSLRPVLQVMEAYTGKSPQAVKGLTVPHEPLFPSLDNGEFKRAGLMFLSSLLPFFLFA